MFIRRMIVADTLIRPSRLPTRNRRRNGGTWMINARKSSRYKDLSLKSELFLRDQTHDSSRSEVGSWQVQPLLAVGPTPAPHTRKKKHREKGEYFHPPIFFPFFPAHYISHKKTNNL